MKSTVVFVMICSLSLSALGYAQEKLPRDATIPEIPGVISAGVKWQEVWHGTDNADGIVGTTDGGLLFAQEQPSTVRKLDGNDRSTIYVGDTHGTGAVAIDS